MQVVFTGHRDRHTHPDELFDLWQEFPDATWVHGGARGFDSQVADYAKAHGIPQRVVLPDYHACAPRVAPLRRNDLMLETADILVACWDGRTSGGTAYTVRKAKARQLPIRLVVPISDD